MIPRSKNPLSVQSNYSLSRLFFLLGRKLILAVEHNWWCDQQRNITPNNTQLSQKCVFKHGFWQRCNLRLRVESSWDQEQFEFKSYISKTVGYPISGNWELPNLPSSPCIQTRLHRCTLSRQVLMFRQLFLQPWDPPLFRSPPQPAPRASAAGR